VYVDRPREQWPRGAGGELAMVTLPLDLDALLREAAE
jgi:catechol-2,3-dioxygenase